MLFYQDLMCHIKAPCGFSFDLRMRFPVCILYVFHVCFCLFVARVCLFVVLFYSSHIMSFTVGFIPRSTYVYYMCL